VSLALPEVVALAHLVLRRLLVLLWRRGYKMVFTSSIVSGRIS
jgi:hypothetical protein